MARPSSDPRIKSVYMPKTLRERLQAFADANGMSLSEVVEELEKAYLDGKVEGTPRKRTSVRVTLWMRNPERHARFMKRVKQNGTTFAGALELAIGDDG